MGDKLRLLRRSDVTRVVSGWNSCFPYDRISEAKFSNTIFGDANYEVAGHLVAVENQKIVGFVASVARDGIVGRDGAGTIEEQAFGYIKGFFVLNEYRNSMVRTELLNGAIEYLKSKGKTIARIGQYTGDYFSPGVDVRYGEYLGFLQKSGFMEIDAEEDVAVDLAFFTPSDYQKQAMKRVAEMGVVITAYHTKFLGMMRDFVKRINYPQWFPENWESSFQGMDHHNLVARRGSAIVGWARFFKEADRWWFGPIAVLDDMRLQGIGTCLLLESVLQMRAHGALEVTAGWANVPFYVKNGWRTSRRYSILQKTLN